jgi:competence ComEA-like helix-hairpin-helix protein
MKQLRIITPIIIAFVLSLSTTAAAKRSRSGRKARVVRGVCNINTAPLKKLVLLPYVGKSRARTIIRYRNRHPFRNTRDLMRVKGIGKKTYHTLKPHLTVTGPTTIRKVPPPRRRGRRK